MEADEVAVLEAEEVLSKETRNTHKHQQLCLQDDTTYLTRTQGYTVLMYYSMEFHCLGCTYGNDILNLELMTCTKFV